jgi:hypothetical protein
VHESKGSKPSRRLIIIAAVGIVAVLLVGAVVASGMVGGNNRATDPGPGASNGDKDKTPAVTGDMMMYLNNRSESLSYDDIVADAGHYFLIVNVTATSHLSKEVQLTAANFSAGISRGPLLKPVNTVSYQGAPWPMLEDGDTAIVQIVYDMTIGMHLKHLDYNGPYYQCYWWLPDDEQVVKNGDFLTYRVYQYNQGVESEGSLTMTLSNVTDTNFTMICTSDLEGMASPAENYSYTTVNGILISPGFTGMVLDNPGLKVSTEAMPTPYGYKLVDHYRMVLAGTTFDYYIGLSSGIPFEITLYNGVDIYVEEVLWDTSLGWVETL